MLIDVAPIQAIPYFAPRAFGVVAHFQNIVAARYVGFGGHLSAIGILTHTINIRHHHPIIRINEEFHKPAIDFIRIEFTQVHEVTQHHQSFDVMTVSGLQYFLNGSVNGLNAGGTIIK